MDLSMWLHEFGRMSAKSVMLDQNFTKVIEHCVHNANVLRFMGCNVIFVADNREKAALGKEWTNDKRKALATKAWEKYLASPGDETLLKKAVRVSLALQDAVLMALRKEKFDTFQAPLEADSQMAMLYREKKVFLVMSGDTDCVIHGVAMQMFSWNIHAGECSVFNSRLIEPVTLEGLSLAAQNDLLEKCPITKLLAGLPSGLRLELLQCFALCSGCDYFKVDGWGHERAKVVLRAGVKHFYDKVGLARGPLAIADWLSSQLSLKPSKGGRFLAVKEVSICGVNVTNDALAPLIFESFCHFAAAPAFSIDQQRYLAGRYHFTPGVDASNLI